MFSKLRVIRSLAILFFAFLSLLNYCQSVSVKNFELRSQEVIFAFQYGNQVLEKSRAVLDENGFVYIYNESLHSGIYYLIFTDSTSIEFMYDSLYPGTVKIEKTGAAEFPKIEGPSVTQEFNNYMRQLSISGFNKAISAEKNNLSTFNRKQSDSLLKVFADKIPGSMLDIYLRAQINIDIPAYNPPAEIENKDSAIWIFKLNYFAKHYFDRIDFNDSRLLYTPVYTDMVDYYLDKLTSKDYHKINENIDLLMDKTADNRVFQQYTAEYILNKLSKKKNDPVFENSYLHVIEKYYLKSGFTWIKNSEVAYFTSEYNRRKPALLGEPAPEISMINSDGSLVSLQNIGKPIIVLYFFDYDCPLCEKITPELRKITARYNYLDIAVLAICTGENPENWKNYIAGKRLSSWVNVFDKDKIDQNAVKYNLSHTPTLFLLDGNKIIIDKNFTVAQLENTLFRIATKAK